MNETQNALKTSIIAPLFDLEVQGYFSSVAGFTNAQYTPFTDAAKHVYAQIFAILNHFGVDYYVFAGTLVGYVRNGQMPPWMDDIDIMIFERDIALFEDTVAPYLQACGFNCKPVGRHWAGGGYHALALQHGDGREDTITFAQDVDVRVPWAQFDVFFSSIDDAGLVKNPTGWGLYHRKDIRADWVQPAQMVTMNDLRFPIFADPAADVHHEYGDVMRTVVVQTHGTQFLAAANMPWNIFSAEFDRVVDKIIRPLPPSVSAADYAAYDPQPGICLSPAPKAHFDEIAALVIESHGAEVVLSGPEHVFWVMDLKRLMPQLHITVEISTVAQARHAALLRQFIDATRTPAQSVKEHYDAMIAALHTTLGDTAHPGARNAADVL